MEFDNKLRAKVDVLANKMVDKMVEALMTMPEEVMKDTKYPYYMYNAVMRLLKRISDTCGIPKVKIKEHIDLIWDGLN